MSALEWDIFEWPPESLEREAKFGIPAARLYPFIGKMVTTPRGRGKLVQVFREEVEVIVDDKVVFLHPTKCIPEVD